mmetsp:Transcript_39190/g.126752  ORF Transcript_39190/g.126752 Transcript_39190/m.126752 type:complete len:381 (-) Transcript_39190:262-1404(-)
MMSCCETDLRQSKAPQAVASTVEPTRTSRVSSRAPSSDVFTSRRANSAPRASVACVVAVTRSRRPASTSTRMSERVETESPSSMRTVPSSCSTCAPRPPDASAVRWWRGARRRCSVVGWLVILGGGISTARPPTSGSVSSTLARADGPWPPTARKRGKYDDESARRSFCVGASVSAVKCRGMVSVASGGASLPAPARVSRLGSARVSEAAPTAARREAPLASTTHRRATRQSRPLVRAPSARRAASSASVTRTTGWPRTAHGALSAPAAAISKQSDLASSLCWSTARSAPMPHENHSPPIWPTTSLSGTVPTCDAGAVGSSSRGACVASTSAPAGVAASVTAGADGVAPAAAASCAAETTRYCPGQRIGRAGPSGIRSVS